MEEKIKICHLTSVHNRYDPRILLKQCTSLKKFGYDVTLIVANGIEDEVYDGVKIVDVGKPKNRLHRAVNISWKIYRRAKKIAPKIYHFHDPELIPVGLLLRLQGKKVIYDIHEDYLTSAISKEMNSIVKWFLRIGFVLLEGLARRTMTTIIAEKYYSERFPNAIKILNYPIIDDLKSERIRQFPNERLIYTGNVTFGRGAGNHADILNLTDRYSVHLIGKTSPEVYDELMKVTGENSERLCFEGIDSYIPFAKIKQKYSENWLAGLAIFSYSVHYYQKELTKFFEYMAEGLPIICSDFPVWKKLIEENNCGICVDYRKKDDIVDAINFLYENPEKAREMGFRGRQLVHERFNWGQEELKLREIYEKLHGVLNDRS